MHVSEKHETKMLKTKIDTEIIKRYRATGSTNTINKNKWIFKFQLPP